MRLDHLLSKVLLNPSSNSLFSFERTPWHFDFQSKLPSILSMSQVQSAKPIKDLGRVL